MIPHKTPRGSAALDRLKAFEGVPHPYDKVKRKVVPNAITVIRLRPGRKYCRLGDLSSAVGWKHGELIEKLEARRKVKASAYFQTKTQLNKVKAAAAKTAAKDLTAVNTQLAAFGY